MKSSKIGTGLLVIFIVLGFLALKANKIERIYHFFSPPEYDGTSDEAFYESIKKVSSSLTDSQRSTAKQAVTQIAQRIMQTPPRPDEEGLSAKERLLRRMDGKNHDEFMAEYYLTMVEFTEHRLKQAKERLEQLEKTGGAAELIETAKKDVEDYEHSRQSWMLKLSRAQAQL